MTPDPVAPGSRTEGDFNVSQVWLDALARGACDEEAFLRAVQMLTRRSPEAAWDSLALLDQYYRRGKIKTEVFKRVKSRLGSQLLGPALDVEVSVPLRRQEHPPPPAAIVVPVPTPVAATPAPVATPAPAATPATVAATVPAPALVPVAVAAPAMAAAPAPAPVHATAMATTPVTLAQAAVPLTPPPAFAPTPAALAPVSQPAAPELVPQVASPPAVSFVPPARGAAGSAPVAAAPSARTVPIGADSAFIPVLNPADRPAEEIPPGTPREVTVGDVLRSRYAIKSVLGLGGTGTVFEAIDRYRLDLPDSGQRVAVKVLHSNAARQNEVLTDLRREFQLLQSLSHPNIVRAHEYDRDGDTAFFTMEYLSGLSLESVLSAHREVVLERIHALMIIRDVAAALEHAHSRGVVHGDLNPGNIFITNDGEIRVLDFGAAHVPSAIPTVTEAAWDAAAYATPRYASCQLLDGERADVRDDTYSLACILYVLLAGKHPFGELNAAQARAQRLKPSRPAGLTGRQWHALRSGLAFDRQRRPADIAAWLDPFELPKPEARLPVLLALLKISPRRSRRGGNVMLIVTLLGLAAAGWWASGHMPLVSQTAAQTGAGLNEAFASAVAALRQAWAEGKNAISGSPAAAPGSAEPGASRVDQGVPQTATPAAPAATIPPRIGPPPARNVAPSVPVPATHIAATRNARSAATAPASSTARLPFRALGAAPPSHARIELAADTIEVPPSDPAAHLIVRRTGNLRSDASFTWWTESGTAKPGQDFMNVKEHEEHFQDGKAVANLFVPVVADPTRKQPKSFYVVINDPSDGASLGKRTLTMVTILPSD